MRRHDTPDDVARELARHAPRRLRRILDPSVGSGALLKPLTSILSKRESRVLCIDSDSRALQCAECTLSPLLSQQIRYVNADFLQWSRNVYPVFDLIVMNPPFAGQKSQLRRIKVVRRDREVCIRYRFMPAEAAFVCRAIELLRAGGRLLAVLPSSVVSSETTEWLREHMFRHGAIRFVHELAPRSFPNVESRMYLFVFDRAKKQRNIILYNHDLADPERLDLRRATNNGIRRLDFGYHKAIQKLTRLVEEERFGWRPLRDVAVVLRGSVKSPFGSETVVHTTEYSKGFWTFENQRQIAVSGDRDRTIRPGDLLARRVGRNCHRSFGRPLGLVGFPCSDCVLIVRPKDSHNSLQLLFAVQVLLEVNWAGPLIERGTGARYITHESVLDLAIPTKLHKCFAGTYALFVEAQWRRSFWKWRIALCRAVRRIERISGV